MNSLMDLTESSSSYSIPPPVRKRKPLLPIDLVMDLSEDVNVIAASLPPNNVSEVLKTRAEASVVAQSSDNIIVLDLIEGNKNMTVKETKRGKREVISIDLSDVPYIPAAPSQNKSSSSSSAHEVIVIDDSQNEGNDVSSTNAYSKSARSKSSASMLMQATPATASSSSSSSISCAAFSGKCGICYDDITEDMACKCPYNHSLCVDCLEAYISSARAIGALNYVDNKGKLVCYECHQPYDARAFSADCFANVFESLQELRITKVKEAELKVELEKQEVRLRKEFEVTMMKEGVDRDVHRLVVKIRNDVFNLKCPACSCVFVDFDGCFALHCGVNSCRRAFCAWCLIDCGKDAHAHVQRCPEGKGVIHANFNTFQEHHRKRRQVKLISLLAEYPLDVQKLVREALKKDLSDLGIKLPALPKK